MSRPVITGMGIISALGNDRKETLKSIKSGKNTLVKITTIPHTETLMSDIGGEVIINKAIPSHIKDKNQKLAFLAIKEAIENSGINFNELDDKKCAIVFATCNGNALTLEKIYKNLNDEKNLLDKVKEQCTLSLDIKNIFNLKGATFNIVTACSASAHAMILASDLIKSNKYDIILVCGSDSFCELSLGGFNSFQALSPNGASPFSEEIGLSLGEGAGCMIIETENHAKKREANIHAQISGTSFLSDAYHITSPDINGDGLRRTMDAAIAESGINKKNIKVVCAHGTGTATNDAIESLSITNCFEKLTNDIKVTSTKSMTGHTLGAAAITQAIIMIDCMQNDLIPSILNFKKNREGCNLNYVKNKPLKFSFYHFISNSLAFGGNNASIIFSKFLDKKPDSKKLKNKKIVITGNSDILPTLKNTKKLKTPSLIKFDDFSLDIGENKNLRKYKKTPKIAQFAIEATKNALKNAKIDNPENIGILWNHYINNLKTFEDTYFDILKFGMEYSPATSFSNTVFSAISGHVSAALKIKGLQTSFWSQFAPFASIFYAKELIKQNKSNIFVIGSSEEISVYEKKIMQENCNKDKAITEGASVIILEDEKSAKKRNAKIYAEVLDVNINNAKFEDCIQDCLKNSKLKKNDIGLNIHAEFGVKQQPYFENSINSQDLLGTLESSTALVNIGLAIKSKYKYIALTATTMSGTNYCMTLRNASYRG